MFNTKFPLIKILPETFTLSAKSSIDSAIELSIYLGSSCLTVVFYSSVSPSSLIKIYGSRNFSTIMSGVYPIET